MHYLPIIIDTDHSLIYYNFHLTTLYVDEIFLKTSQSNSWIQIYVILFNEFLYLIRDFVIIISIYLQNIVSRY